MAHAVRGGSVQHGLKPSYSPFTLDRRAIDRAIASLAVWEYNACMTQYRRAKGEGGLYFFTLVTCQRKPLFVEPLARSCLRRAIVHTRQCASFCIVAFCLLPEHLHCIWELPTSESDYSQHWARIKSLFTREYLDAGGQETAVSTSRRRKRERGVWQRRFWEHQIRDEHDLQKHVDYIHFNPVKHSLVDAVPQWPWSTYHRYARQGRYLQRHWSDMQEGLEDLAIPE